ncbi:MAG TPA: hypothetical protein VMG10_11655 [Gemmataceae bacterium]|nr:hypothetical protein [Gemmataceae bacterium]
MNAKTIAIVCKMTADDRVVLLDDDRGTLSREHFYSHVSPAVGFVAIGSMKIGSTNFCVYRFMPPSKGSQVMHLSADSLLFEGVIPRPGLDKLQLAQLKGGQLFKELIHSLDTVAAFRHLHFARSLLTVTSAYVPLKVNRSDSDHLFAVGFRHCAFTDKPLADALVAFLVGYPDDDDALLTRIVRRLNQLESRGRLVVRGLVDRIRESLACLKQQLAQNRLSWDDDPYLWQLSLDANMPWLRDWAAHPNWSVPLAEGFQAPGREFGDYYKMFRRASDRIHRLVRTAPLHAYFKVFLPSKYVEHGLTGQVQAALLMHDEGIVKQPNPAPNESLEAVQRYRELIRAAQLPPHLSKSLAGDDNYPLFVPTVEEVLGGLLSTPTSFTRAQLLHRLENLESQLVQLLGGAAGAALANLAEFAARRVRFLGLIINAEPANGALTLKDLREALEQHCIDNSEAAFVKKFLVGIDPASADLRAAVKEAFVIQLAIEAKSRFAQDYLGSRQQIKADDLAARTVYRAHLCGSVSANDGEPGLPGLVVSPSVMTAEVELPYAPEHRAASFEEVLENAASRQVGPVKFCLTDEAKNLLADGQQVGIFSEGDQVGELKRKGLFLEIRPLPGQPASQLLSRKAKVRADKKEVSLVSLKLAGLEVFAPFGNPNLPLSDVANGLDAVAVAAGCIRERLRSLRPHQQGVAADLVGIEREQILSEYMAATPEKATVLDQPDLSMGMGVMLAMVRHVADPRDGESAFEPRPTPFATAGLQKLDLSLLYRVPRDRPDQMAALVQYDFALTQQLDTVSDYLREVWEVGETAEALRGTGSRLVLISATLAGHANVPASASFVPVKYAPAVVYVARHGVASPSNAAAELQQFAQRIAQAMPFTNVAVPVMVSPLDLGTAAALPVIDGLTFKLPKLKQACTGLDTSEDATPVTRLIQTDPYLLLAVALAAPQAALGFLPADPDTMPAPDDRGRAYWSPVDQLVYHEWPALLNVVPFPSAALSCLLHNAWTSFRRADGVNALFDSLAGALLLTALGNRARVVDQSLKGDVRKLLVGLKIDDADFPGMPEAVLRAVLTLMIQAGMAWAAPTADGPPVALGSPMRLQIAPGKFVNLNSHWTSLFATLLP